MHAGDVLHYGHLTLLGSLERVPPGRWELGGVCGVWSVKNIVAHLASYELVLVDLLGHLRDGRGDGFVSPIDAAFNDEQVARREALSPAETLEEYRRAHEQAPALARALPEAAFRQAGGLPWYGPEYDLDDYLVYTFYGHKREHSAQVDVFTSGAARS